MKKTLKTLRNYINVKFKETGLNILHLMKINSKQKLIMKVTF